MGRSLLVIDDEAITRSHLRLIFQADGYEVVPCESAEDGLREIAERGFSAVLCDVKLAGMDGLAFLTWVREHHPEVPVVTITAFGTIENAVAAMRQGAADYVTKPFGADEIRIVVERAIERGELKNEVVRLRGEIERRYAFGSIVSRSPAMFRVFEMIRTVADTDSTVLVTGETGTGKEMVARSIHFNSLRKAAPFVAINCGALTETLLESELFGHEKGAFTGAVRRKEGRFEAAHRGTLFLDEVACMPPPMQVKLLRVLQDGEFERVGGTQPVRADVRVIAATNQALADLVGSGRFREDLYYRLNVVPIYLPPLRERPEDIPTLALYFLSHYRKQFGREADAYSDRALEQMLRYRWPGNVRELKHVIERGVLLSRGPVIDALDLPKEAGPIADAADSRGAAATAQPLREYLRDCERRYYTALLRRHEGNVTRALAEARIPSKTFYRRLHAVGLDPRLLRG
ncbi:MAG: sigma-54-dependent Fis family transcriptional regulator [Deltaproteobacteria bacterium]|nr:sigma-54-dependent Fis family transcriptional regulator [Deltaproteobacteria bacterium]